MELLSATVGLFIGVKWWRLCRGIDTLAALVVRLAGRIHKTFGIGGDDAANVAHLELAEIELEDGRDRL